MTFSICDSLKEWIDRRVSEGHFASASDYIIHLIGNEWGSTSAPALSVEDLQRAIDDALASGVSEKTLNEAFADAVRITKERGTYRE